jgi:hypothetical protein
MGFTAEFYIGLLERRSENYEERGGRQVDEFDTGRAEQNETGIVVCSLEA